MQPEKPLAFTFIVRLWREKDDCQTIWRGSVDHVQSGERAYFQAASHFLEIISSFVNEVIPEGGEPDGMVRSDEPRDL